MGKVISLAAYKRKKAAKKLTLSKGTGVIPDSYFDTIAEVIQQRSTVVAPGKDTYYVGC